MTPEPILEKIQTAREQRHKELDLGFEPALGPERLSEVPNEVFDLTHLEYLNLSNNALTSIPESISKLQNLTLLDLSSNELNSLPRSISRMQSLTTLDLSQTKLESLPRWISQLSNLRSLALSYLNLDSVPDVILEMNLTSLDLSYNQLTSIPHKIMTLKNLEFLQLSANNFTYLPDSIGEIKNLRSLQLFQNKLTTLPKTISQLVNLREISLGRNGLAEVPEVIFQLDKLTGLNLAGNVLTEVPAAIDRLQQLEVLWLINNKLTTLPDSISRLARLRVLGLSHNKLESIPEAIYNLSSLERLEVGNPLQGEDATGNQIKEISSSILRLTNLSFFDVTDCPIETPPPEVVSKGISAIKDYFRQLEDRGQDYLYEAKLLILGEPGAGKTSLAKKIENSDYQLREEDSTQGIEISPWIFQMDKGQEFRANIWDFGGQEIYHATHQFFLTKRSLYVLVADTRQEDTDFYYWLNVVELLSDNSPILIVKNEKQDRHREINVKQLRGEFSNLKETLPTNLATNRGLDKVLDEIKHCISHLPQIGAPLPKTWVKVREALEKAARNYISINDYLNICQANGFSELKDKMQLLVYLHDLGVCLHFADDPLLKKTVILAPKWGTDAVYKVLDNKKVIANLGKFDRDDLANIWIDQEYADMEAELLQLMINFKLCYRIPGSDVYIAPQLLTENQPTYYWDDTNNLILRYTYEFMPKGIVTQFIVAMHRLIAQQKQVWKSGVILEMDDTRAEVIEFYGKREIKVRVAGNRKKELMTIVSYELDKIHASYARLKYDRLIPCNCSGCKDTPEPHFYRLETLQRFVNHRRFNIQCEMSFVLVDIRGLIDEVIDKGQYAALDQHNLSSKEVPGQVFISYSHEDKRWLDDLLIMLKPLTRSGQLSVWSDSKIIAGSKWRDEIAQALRLAKVAVLLVSPHFLASDFIAEHELPPLLAAAENDGVRILWVPVSDSMYKETEIAGYQAVSDPSQPLDSLSPAEANRVMVRICEQIKEAANSPGRP